MQGKSPASRQNLLFTMEQNRQTRQRPRPQTFISTRMTSSPDPLSKTLNSTPQQRQFGGAERDRTADPLLAKQVLSQLSYSPVKLRVSTERVQNPRRPINMVGPGRLELPTSRLSGVRSNHLSYGPSPRLNRASPVPAGVPVGVVRHP